MAQILKLAAHFELFTVIPSSASVAEGLKRLQDAQVNFAVVGDIQQPQTLIQANHLATLTGVQQRPLLEILEQLPPLVILDGTEGDLVGDEIIHLMFLLDQTGAPGVVVYQDRQVRGIIATDVVEAGLSSAPISPGTTKGLYNGLAGNPVLPTSIYVCHKCAASNPPPPLALPREGDKAPVCPRYWFHGSMQREDA